MPHTANGAASTTATALMIMNDLDNVHTAELTSAPKTLRTAIWRLCCSVK